MTAMGDGNDGETRAPSSDGVGEHARGDMAARAAESLRDVLGDFDGDGRRVEHLAFLRADNRRR
jgi:hypothetical protein